MKLNFVKTSPSENMTALITDYVPRSMYSPIANKLLDYEYLHVEQVGFIVKPIKEDALLRLEMSGGEFCGNALLSAAAYCFYREITKKKDFYLEISGADSPLKCWVMKKSPYLYNVRAEMVDLVKEKQIEINIKNRRVEGRLITFDGITHFVTNFLPEEDEYTLILEELSKYSKEKAIGIIPFNLIRDNEYKITPLVYVPETGSKIYERACGSGTLALGLHLAKGVNNTILKVHQPGGTIKVEINEKNYISTNVRITSEGLINLDI